MQSGQQGFVDVWHIHYDAYVENNTSQLRHFIVMAC